LSICWPLTCTNEGEERSVSSAVDDLLVVAAPAARRGLA
jgi:hypothetical protein